jgi:hypothetical protein
MRSISVRHPVFLLVALMLAACSEPQEPAASPAPAQSTTLTTAAPTTTALTTASTVSSTEATAVTPFMSKLEPGTYSVDPDGRPDTIMTVEFTVTEPGWSPFRGPFKPGPANALDYVAVKFVTITDVASPACNSTAWVPAGNTAEDQASGLAEIGDFVIQSAPTAVTAYGYDGYHLVLEVPDLGYEPGHGFLGCDDGYFDGYEGPTISRYYQGPHQVVEFWALDVEGAPLLIEATWFPESPAEDVAQLQAILDSVLIRP